MAKILLGDKQWKNLFNQNWGSFWDLSFDWESSEIIFIEWRKWRIYYNQNIFFELFIFSERNDHIKSRLALEKEMGMYIEMFKNLTSAFEGYKKVIDNKFTRLVHNIKEANGRNIWGFETISEINISTTKLKEILVEKLKNQSNIEQIIQILLNNKKNSDEIKNEITTFKLLDNPHPEEILKPRLMPIHSVLLWIINVYFLEFLSRDILIKICDTQKQLNFDYTSFTVIIHHIFDNALKYCKSHSKIEISFREITTGFEIKFQMISTEVLPDEKEKIFHEWYSWNTASKSWKNWDWLGMYIAKKVAVLNNIDIEFWPWEFDSTDNEGSRYCNNEITIRFSNNSIVSN